MNAYQLLKSLTTGVYLKIISTKNLLTKRSSEWESGGLTSKLKRTNYTGFV